MIKRYQIVHQGITAFVEAEQEGEGRYMVRMSIPGKLAPLRIGYVMGGNQRWQIEFKGNNNGMLKASASLKSACASLAEQAVNQSSIMPYFENKVLS